MYVSNGTGWPFSVEVFVLACDDYDDDDGGVRKAQYGSFGKSWWDEQVTRSYLYRRKEKEKDKDKQAEVR